MTAVFCRLLRNQIRRQVIIQFSCLHTRNLSDHRRIAQYFFSQSLADFNVLSKIPKISVKVLKIRADTRIVGPDSQKRRTLAGDVMTSKEFFEQTATSIAALDRDELKRRIRNFRGRFKLDFTEDYLNQLNIDRLRHILLAAHLSTSSTY